MIPWWTIVMPTIACIGWAYLLGKTKERERCVNIAVDAVGRARIHEEARTASHIAGIISGDLPAPGPAPGNASKGGKLAPAKVKS